MRAFMDDDFLLPNKPARELYHQYAATMPIFDYHCHLSPQHIAEDHHFSDLNEAWLDGDHYKWRALRANGVAERWVSGKAPAREKFQRWAETVPATIGNPLYHWTHLELRRHFGIETLLDGRTAQQVWDEANAELARREMGARGILAMMNVRYVGTTDDPADSLEHHRRFAVAAQQSATDLVVAPSFRPDRSFAVADPRVYREYLQRLAAAAELGAIRNFDDLRAALRKRIEVFHEHGCRVSDHSLPVPMNRDYTETQLNAALTRLLDGKPIEAEEVASFTTAVMDFVGHEYAARDWTMQIHIGALRNTNTRMFRLVGPDAGFDSMNDATYAPALAGFLDRLDRDEALPRTVLYNLNPRDNELIASMVGNFQEAGAASKMQFGSGWWYNDQKIGMENQLRAFANCGLLSRFVGMLTDSRSFLSFPRHEYFRRILCAVIGTWVEDGEAPHDMALLGGMVQDICFNNAVRYFRVPGVTLDSNEEQ